MFLTEQRKNLTVSWDSNACCAIFHFNNKLRFYKLEFKRKGFKLLVKPLNLIKATENKDNTGNKRKSMESTPGFANPENSEKKEWKILEGPNFIIFISVSGNKKWKMLSRLACSKSFITPSLLKSAIQNVPRRQVLRTFAEESKFKTRSERIGERMTLKERAMAPPGKHRQLVSNHEILKINLF